MRLLDRLFAAPRDPRDEVRPLWRYVVEQARQPEWYREGGVADTLEGRFDMVTLVLALAVLRMERSDVLAPLTAPLTEIFVEEMDGQLRQSGERVGADPQDDGAGKLAHREVSPWPAAPRRPPNGRWRQPPDG